MTSIEHWVRSCCSSMQQADLFYGHGTDNALDEAAWLVLHALGKSLDGSFDGWDEDVNPADASAIETLLKDRIESRKPLAYLLGEAWFCGYPFFVNEQVLVPRSPFAELIFNQFRPWVAPDSTGRALDLCTGSGCIAAGMALNLPGWSVDASDISEGALQVARRNIRRHGLEERVNVIESDLFSALGGQRYDLIVTNPPYVSRASVDALPKEYTHEPELGLLSGSDGLDLPLKILAESASFLNPDGVLFCEVGESAEALEALLPGAGFTWVEFEHGGDGIFTIGHQELSAAADSISKVMEKRENVI